MPLFHHHKSKKEKETEEASEIHDEEDKSQEEESGNHSGTDSPEQSAKLKKKHEKEKKEHNKKEKKELERKHHEEKKKAKEEHKHPEKKVERQSQVSSDSSSEANSFIVPKKSLEDEYRVEKEKLEEEKKELEKIIKEQKDELQQIKKKEEDRLSRKEIRRKEKEKAAIDRYKIMKGFLSKQGHVVKNWKIRYFFIQRDALSYYKDLSKKDLRGKINLIDCIIEEEEIPGKENCFLVKPRSSQESRYVLSATSPEERQQWMDAIRYISTGDLPQKTKIRSTMKNKRIPKAGFLDKEGHFVKSWKARWFDLRAEKGTTTLDYYLNYGDPQPKGHIRLKNALIESGSIPGKEFAFVIRTKEGDYYMSCKDGLDCNQWLEATKVAVFAIREEELQQEMEKEEAEKEIQKQAEIKQENVK